MKTNTKPAPLELTLWRERQTLFTCIKQYEACQAVLSVTEKNMVWDERVGMELQALQRLAAFNELAGASWRRSRDVAGDGAPPSWRLWWEVPWRRNIMAQGHHPFTAHSHWNEALSQAANRTVGLWGLHWAPRKLPECSLLCHCSLVWTTSHSKERETFFSTTSRRNVFPESDWWLPIWSCQPKLSRCPQGGQPLAAHSLRGLCTQEVSHVPFLLRTPQWSSSPRVKLWCCHGGGAARPAPSSRMSLLSVSPALLHRPWFSYSFQGPATPGPLHMLFSLPVICFSHLILEELVLSKSSLRPNATFSEKPYLKW